MIEKFKVAIIAGSKSDAEFVNLTMEELTSAGIEHEVSYLSAHRQPDKVREFSTNASSKGFKVIIAMAGFAAALPGVSAISAPPR